MGIFRDAIKAFRQGMKEGAEKARKGNYRDKGDCIKLIPSDDSNVVIFDIIASPRYEQLIMTRLIECAEKNATYYQVDGNRIRIVFADVARANSVRKSYREVFMK